jgi:arylformamidase
MVFMLKIANVASRMPNNSCPMPTLLRLSYPLKAAGPVWPDAPAMKLQQATAIRKGDPANTHLVKELFNHFGTHIDGPNHFHDAAKKIAELPLGYFCYSRPFDAELSKSFGEKVTPEDLAPLEAPLRQADLLLIRTAFSRHRSTREADYTHNGPGHRLRHL